MSNPKYQSNDPFARDRERRNLQKTKKAAKRNRDESKPRRNKWIDLVDEDPEVWEDFTQTERIMPRDEVDRRNQTDSTADDMADVSNPVKQGDTIGQVVEVSSGLCRVWVHGRTLLCSLRGSLSAEESGRSNVVAVGDRVMVSEVESGAGVVEACLPRVNEIARPDPSNVHLRQVLAANVDQLLIIASWRSPNVWPELVDRYMITAQRNDVRPVVCINKIDLAESQDEVDDFTAAYQGLGVDVILTSAVTDQGLSDLRGLLDGRISVLAGLSGVGKSSLLSAVQPGFNLRQGEVNEERGQGRHTTTQSTMLPFGDQGWVIDTPGIREFGLVGLAPTELLAYYPDLGRFAGGCRFANCTHSHEPACAIREAAQQGRVSATRYDSFRKIWDDLSG